MESTITHGKDPAGYLQPDYQFSHNGYGLLQLSANFVFESSYAGQSTKYFPRGSSLNIVNGYDLGKALMGYPWTCVKSEETGRDGQIIYVKAFFAAIEPDKGDFTETEAAMTSAVVSEPIESHPNFTKVQATGIGDGETPLGGIWVDGVPPTIPDDVNNKFRALWQKTVNVQVGAESYNFVGFAPADSTKTPNRKAGVRSWMRPSITLKLTSYTTNATNSANACSYVGMIVKDGVDFLRIPEAYKGIGANGLYGLIVGEQRDWLVTNANMEVFGGLYKVQADLLLSGVLGWDKDIYCDTQQ